MDAQLQESLQRAAAVLQELGAREVYVFGSAARGTLRPDSDVDLAVSGLPPQVFFRAMSKAADALGRPLDLIDLVISEPLRDRLKDYLNFRHLFRSAYSFLLQWDRMTPLVLDCQNALEQLEAEIRAFARRLQ